MKHLPALAIRITLALVLLIFGFAIGLTMPFELNYTHVTDTITVLATIGLAIFASMGFSDLKKTERLKARAHLSKDYLSLVDISITEFTTAFENLKAPVIEAPQSTSLEHRLSVLLGSSGELSRLLEEHKLKAELIDATILEYSKKAQADVDLVTVGIEESYDQPLVIISAQRSLTSLSKLKEKLIANIQLR